MVLPMAANAQRSGIVDDALQGAVERKEVAGVVAMAADRDGVFYQGAFGLADIAQARPLKLDSLFRIASMTKAITSVAAMQLIEQGRLGLDDPAEKYLPQLAKLPVFESFDAATGDYKLRPATKSITARHLFTHTSGLGYAFTSPIVRDFKPRPGEAYPVGPLLFEPGEQWLYSTSTEWLGRLVETISGQPLEEYFRQHIFDPLKMSDTFYYVPRDKQAPRRHGPSPPTRRIIDQGGRCRRQRRASCASAAAACRRPRATTSASPACCSTVASSTAPASCRPSRWTRWPKITSAPSALPALKTALPERSEDFSFIADGRDKWGLGFLITADTVPGKRSAGSLSWGGINNTYFWIDRTRGITGVILMQFLPFADRKALALHDAFERGVYRIAA